MIAQLLNASKLGPRPSGIPFFGVIFLPILIEQLFITFVSNVDAILLSYYSDQAVASVGLALPILRIGTIFLFIVSTGSTILLAQLVEQKNPEREVSIMASALVANVLIGALIGVFLWFFGKDILTLMHAQNLAKDAYSYLIIIGASLVFQGIVTSLSAFLRAYGEVKAPMNVSIFINLFNIFADIAVVLTPFSLLGKGTVGVANATLLSRVLGSFLIGYSFLVFVRKKYRIAHFKKIKLRNHLKFSHKSYLKDILNLGAPSALETIFFLLSQAIITSFIAYMGTKTLAARVYTETLTSFIFSITIALGMAGQLFVGRFLGRGLKEYAFEFSKENRKGALAISFLASLALALASPLILPLFSQDPIILRLTRLTMMVSILHQPGRTNNVMSIHYLNAAGEVKYPLLVSIIITYLFTLPLSYLLTYRFKTGLISIYIVFILDEIIRSSLNWSKWTKREWMKKSLLD